MLGECCLFCTYLQTRFFTLKRAIPN
jgi:hypothetical protein